MKDPKPNIREPQTYYEYLHSGNSKHPVLAESIIFRKILLQHLPYRHAPQKRHASPQYLRSKDETNEYNE